MIKCMCFLKILWIYQLRHRVVPLRLNTYFTPQNWKKNHLHLFLVSILFHALSIIFCSKNPPKCHVACVSLCQLPTQPARARVKICENSISKIFSSGLFLVRRCYLFFIFLNKLFSCYLFIYTSFIYLIVQT